MSDDTFDPAPPVQPVSESKATALEAGKGDAHIFRLLVDAVKDYAIFALDPNGLILTWNQGAERLKGYSSSEVIGSHFSRFYTRHDIDRRHPQHELEYALLHGSYEEEGWRVRKDGTQFWANVVITALKDSTGKLTGFGKVTRDLSRRKEAEEALRESEQRFRLMVESVRDYAIFMLDTEGKVATWNEGARRNKQYEAHEIIGKHFSLFYGPDDISAHKPEMELRIAERTGRFEDTGWRFRKDGTRFWSNVIITAVRTGEGKLLGFSKVTRDLTDRKKAEDAVQAAYENLELRVQERTQELATAKEQAEKAVRVRDDFLSIASHELNTPLTSMKLQVQMRRRQLARGDPQLLTPERFKGILEDDEKRINRLSRLVDDMLDISRLSSGKFTLELHDMDLEALVREVLGRFSTQLEMAGISVEFGCPEPLVGTWDHFRLEQVLVNLVTNAMKYGNQKPVKLSLYREGPVAKLVMRDQGMGIAEVDQERVFQQFERAISANEVSGLGLGLYISKQIIEAHGGTITLESELGQGSTFTVSLPLGLSTKTP